MTSLEVYSYGLKIPKDRIAVVIGKKGSIKKEIEAATKTQLNVDSKEGDVFISGKDALKLYNAREVVKAIGRGFNPELAIILLKPDYALEIVAVEDYVKGDIKRAKGRLIGSEGKARRTIETLSGCYISVYGKTVAIIGKVEDVFVARRAVEGLLRGAKHGNIYKWLEKRKKEILQKEILDGHKIG